MKPRYFFRYAICLMIALLILYPFVSPPYRVLDSILLWLSGGIVGSSWADLRKASREQFEREAETKKPELSSNGAEPFGKRDTTAYIIEKGRTNRW